MATLLRKYQPVIAAWMLLQRVKTGILQKPVDAEAGKQQPYPIKLLCKFPTLPRKYEYLKAALYLLQRTKNTHFRLVPVDRAGPMDKPGTVCKRPWKPIGNRDVGGKHKKLRYHKHKGIGWHMGSMIDSEDCLGKSWNIFVSKSYSHIIFLLLFCHYSHQNDSIRHEASWSDLTKDQEMLVQYNTSSHRIRIFQWMHCKCMLWHIIRSRLNQRFMDHLSGNVVAMLWSCQFDWIERLASAPHESIVLKIWLLLDDIHDRLTFMLTLLHCLGGSILLCRC